MKRIVITRKILLIVSLILVLVAATIVLVRAQSEDTFENPATPSSLNNDKDYGPDTDGEQQEADRHKDELARQNQDEQARDGKKQVEVVITSEDSPSGPEVNVAGYIQGVIEDGGICTATLTQGGEKKTATAKAFADASTTNCPPMPVNLSAGNWQLTLRYDSASSIGSSSKNIKVE